MGPNSLFDCAFLHSVRAGPSSAKHPQGTDPSRFGEGAEDHRDPPCVLQAHLHCDEVADTLCRSVVNLFHRKKRALRKEIEMLAMRNCFSVSL